MCRDDRLNRQAKADTDRPVDGGADMSASLACAGNAERDARTVLQASFGDTFAACRAIAELALVETTQRRRDAVLLRTPPPLRGERHRLDLHRVDPRQTTHAFLIEAHGRPIRSEEHTSELQSLMRNSYAVFCLKNKTILTH